MKRSNFLKRALVATAALLWWGHSICGPVSLDDSPRCQAQQMRSSSGSGAAPSCANTGRGADHKYLLRLPGSPASEAEIVNKPKRNQLLLDMNAGGRLASLGSFRYFQLDDDDPLTYLLSNEELLGVIRRGARIPHAADKLAWAERGDDESIRMPGPEIKHVAMLAFAVDSFDRIAIDDVTSPAVPEPNTAALAVLGVLILLLRATGRQKK